MKKMTDTGKPETSDQSIGQVWTKVSDRLYVHVSGARIERRGYHEKQGWYLVPAVKGSRIRRFDPTPEGCDKALVAFTGQQAAIAFLSRILGKPAVGRGRAG